MYPYIAKCPLGATPPCLRTSHQSNAVKNKATLCPLEPSHLTPVKAEVQWRASLSSSPATLTLTDSASARQSYLTYCSFCHKMLPQQLHMAHPLTSLDLYSIRFDCTQKTVIHFLCVHSTLQALPHLI